MKKQKRSEDALKFIEAQKTMIIAVVLGLFVATMAALSLNYLIQQRKIEAQMAFGKALLLATDRQTLTEQLMEVVQEHGNTVFAAYSLMLIAQNQIDAGEYREAAEVLERALRSAPNVPFLRAIILESRATALEFDGSLDDALKVYAQALAVSGNTFRRDEILLKAALLNLRMGQNEAARQKFEEITKSEAAGERTARIARNELAAFGTK